jgi:hypothetical protein
VPGPSSTKVFAGQAANAALIVAAEAAEALEP